MTSRSDARDLTAQCLPSDGVRLLEALADCLFPPQGGGPGGVRAGAVEYIKRALSGEYSHLAEIYHRGLEYIEERSIGKNGATFIELDAGQREMVVDDLMTEAGDSQIPLGLSGAPSGTALESTESEAGFILLVWQHIREGLYCDPRHGGNVDASVWKWLEYSGPQLHGYTASELLENRIPRRPLRTADDWMERDPRA